MHIMLQLHTHIWIARMSTTKCALTVRCMLPGCCKCLPERVHFTSKRAINIQICILHFLLQPFCVFCIFFMDFLFCLTNWQCWKICDSWWRTCRRKCTELLTTSIYHKYIMYVYVCTYMQGNVEVTVGQVQLSCIKGQCNMLLAPPL